MILPSAPATSVVDLEEITRIELIVSRRLRERTSGEHRSRAKADGRVGPDAHTDRDGPQRLQSIAAHQRGRRLGAGTEDRGLLGAGAHPGRLLRVG